jgi:peroxiredoxin
MPAGTLTANDTLPQFAKLKGADGKSYSSSDFGDRKVVVVVFSCNHCPYVRAYEKRMKDFQKEYGPKGVQLVAINSNDAGSYPEDKYGKMVERAKEQGFNFPYLRDEDQSVAEAFGATHTPQFFVFDGARKLRYSGKMDDNWEHPEKVKKNYLRDAVDALLAGENVEEPETYSIGCTIKWS